MIGLLGGYTTFSSFSLQTLELAHEGRWSTAGANVVLSVALSLGAVWLGHVCGALVRR
jgi:CrcB protein